MVIARPRSASARVSPGHATLAAPRAPKRLGAFPVPPPGGLRGIAPPLLALAMALTCPSHARECRRPLRTRAIRPDRPARTSPKPRKPRSRGQARVSDPISPLPETGCRGISSHRVAGPIWPRRGTRTDPNPAIVQKIRGVSAFRSVIRRWISTAHRTASATLANSAGTPAPVFFTIRPLCSSIFGFINSPRCALRRSCVPS